jgi:hypothetical protein
MSFGVFAGCYGNFALFHKLHNWNGTIGDKGVNSLIHLALWIVPIYEISILVDFFILNTIEFWSGKNPVAMAPGEREVRIVQYKNESYEITATMNRFDVKQLTGKQAGRTAALVYDPEMKAWYVEAGAVREKIIQVDENNPGIVHVLHPDGSAVEYRINANGSL